MKTDEKKPAKRTKKTKVGIVPGSVVDVVCLDDYRIEHGAPIEVSANEAKDLIARSNVLQIVKG